LALRRIIVNTRLNLKGAIMIKRQPEQRRLHEYQRGFTLVEISIVVIILAVLAAVAIPQFSNASTDPRKTNLCTELQLLRQQIELYRLQHDNACPPLVTTGWSVMTEYTDIHGNVSPTSDSTHIYGPYLPAVPVNPLATDANATVIGVAVTAGPGWVYSEQTGKIYATGTTCTDFFNPTCGADIARPPY
jgi:general secretion pathway protein G